MVEHCFWRFSRTFHRAINDHRFDDIQALLDDNIEWALYGPIDMFPCLGPRQGKLAVVQVIRNIAHHVYIRSVDRESTMLEADSAASMFRCCMSARATEKRISLRMAQFALFRSGRLVSMRMLLDTFDLVEQSLGRPIPLPKMIRPG